MELIEFIISPITHRPAESLNDIKAVKDMTGSIGPQRMQALGCKCVEVTWLVNTRDSANHPAQTKTLTTVERDKDT